MTLNSSEEGSASRLYEVISILDENGAMGVTEIASELGIAKSTAHYHLNALRSEGLVVMDESQYKLGLSFLRIGLRVRQRISLFRAAKEEIDKLADKSGELSILAVEQRGLGIFLYKSGGSDALDIDAPIGGTAHMHDRALGKAMLAHYSVEDVNRIVDKHGLPKTTEQTIGTRAELNEELESIRDTGVAFNREESLEGIHGVGVPVLMDEGDVLGSISIAGPSKRLEGTTFTEEYPDLLSESRNVIELSYQHIG